MKAPENRLLRIAMTLAIVLAAFGYWLMHRSYGTTSDVGYRYAGALFTACNQQDQAKLQQISVMVSKSLDAGEVHAAESKWLSAIIERGLAGEWDAASRQVRQLMKDQQRRANPLPAS